jgi:aminodeoxyfutalosine deaminase
MTYRKFKADKLFNGYQLLNAGNTLITDAAGVVVDIVDAQNAGDDIQVLEGILSPGFINCHCHLELSHMKNVIAPHTGLIEFLCTVVQKRGFEKEVIQQAIRQAEMEMYENGIVGVGDICNTADAVAVKNGSKIKWQNFIEVLSLTDEKAGEWMQHYKQVLQQHQQQLHSPNRSALSPHAPYTISPKTFQFINEATAGQIISIHNQEHPAEDELYKTGKGDYLKLFSLFGMQASPLPISGKSSLQTYLPYFTNQQSILLVHNTFIQQDDVSFAADYATENNINLAYCLCPNANMYIENKLPPVEMLVQNNCNMVLGTDSYSSNWQLSIVKEMESLLTMPFFKKMEQQKAIETVLQWATINGAKTLQWNDESGSFEKGKKPGVVLIQPDFTSSVRLM